MSRKNILVVQLACIFIYLFLNIELTHAEATTKSPKQSYIYWPNNFEKSKLI